MSGRIRLAALVLTSGRGEPRIMVRHAEPAACAALAAICGEQLPAPDWLQRPGKTECGPRWKLVCRIYRTLTSRQFT
jgi:hypothetical protein